LAVQEGGVVDDADDVQPGVNRALVDRSKALLRGDYRLLLAATIAGVRSPFRTATIVAQSGVASEIVSREIRFFREAGLLRKLRHGEHDRVYPDIWVGLRQMAVDLGWEAPSTAAVIDINSARARGLPDL
jgi:hypothetical protein